MDALKIGEYIHLSGGIPALVVEIQGNQIKVRSILGREVIILESKAQCLKADMQSGLIVDAFSTIMIAPNGFEYSVSIKHPSLGVFFDEWYKTGSPKIVTDRYVEKDGFLCKATIVNNRYELTTLEGEYKGSMSLESFGILGIHSIPQMLLSAVKNHGTLPIGVKISVSILNAQGDIVFNQDYIKGQENRISDG